MASDTFFKFNDTIYKQKGLSMGSSISPVFVNIFLNQFETSMLNNCLENFTPSFYKRYLDDTFLLFRDEQQTQLFFQYVNNMHNSVKFTFEGEANNTLSFLDVSVRRTADQFVTSVFRKQTFSGISTSYFSSIYFKHKAACLVTLFF